MATTSVSTRTRSSANGISSSSSGGIERVFFETAASSKADKKTCRPPQSKSQSSRLLPRWARIIPFQIACYARSSPSDDDDNGEDEEEAEVDFGHCDKYGVYHFSKTEIQQEEFYLRVEAYHSLCQSVNRVVEKSRMECLVDPNTDRGKTVHATKNDDDIDVDKSSPVREGGGGGGNNWISRPDGDGVANKDHQDVNVMKDDEKEKVSGLVRDVIDFLSMFQPIHCTNDDDNDGNSSNRDKEENSRSTLARMQNTETFRKRNRTNDEITGGYNMSTMDDDRGDNARKRLKIDGDNNRNIPMGERAAKDYTNNEKPVGELSMSCMRNPQHLNDHTLVPSNTKSKQHEDQLMNKDTNAMNVPKHDKEKNNNDNEKMGATDKKVQHQMIEPPKHYHPSLLPMAVIHSPPSILDRREIVNHLYRGFRHWHFKQIRRIHWEKKQKQSQLGGCRTHSSSTSRHTGKYDNVAVMIPAVCIIRTRLFVEERDNKKSRLLHGDLLREIVSQCIQQSKHPSRYLDLLQPKRRGKSSFQYKDALLEWARRQNPKRSFNSVVVIIENLETISPHTLDAFIGTMTSLRSTGMPICLIAPRMKHVTSHALSNVSRSSFDGEMGVAVQDFYVPSTSDLFDCIKQNLFVKNDENLNWPVMLQKSTLARIHESFFNIHLSAVTAVSMLKMALAHHFSKTGSFFSAINCEEFIKRHWQRVAWFSLDAKAKSVTLSANPTSHEIKGWLQSLSLVNKMHQILWKSLVSSLDDEFRRRLAHEEMLRRPLPLENALRKNILKLPGQDVMAILVEWKKELKRCLETRWSGTEKNGEGDGLSLFYKIIDCNGGSSTASIFRELEDGLNEQIILNGTCSLGFEKDLSTCMMELIGTYFREFFGNDFFNVPGFSPHESEVDIEGIFCEDSMFAEPRRAVAGALSNVWKSGTKCEFRAINDTCMAFSVFNTRIITLADWYEDFCEVTDEKDGTYGIEEKWKSFVLAVYELIHCGLVSTGSNFRRKDSFEKMALVWSSGA